jgi:hypothetical protein
VSSAQTSHLDAGTERRLGEAFDRQTRAPDRRERLANRLFLTGFVAAAGALAVLAPAEREFDAVLAVAMLVAYAVADRVEFSVGAGYGAPTQLVFVPMLLLLPTPIVPLLVAAGSVLGAAMRAVRGPVSPRRWVFATRTRGTRWVPPRPRPRGRPGARMAPLARLPAALWSCRSLLDASVAVAAAGCAYGISPREMLASWRSCTASTRCWRRSACSRPSPPRAPHPATALLVLPLVGPARRALARARGAHRPHARARARPTAGRRSCSATCSRRRTSTRAATPRTSSRWP